MNDLFNTSSNHKKTSEPSTYSARDIEVLEGLEPVRLRPGMYIGGVDIHALHHLVSEILDNAMDEVVAGFASEIEVIILENGVVSIFDNGRGIPVDPHPKFPDKSALEVILTTLHSGGKFKEGAYETAGGLHGVGLSVVNALSDFLEIQVSRNGVLYTQTYKKGIPQGPLIETPLSTSIKGTRILFHPDPEIFGDKIYFNPLRIYNLVRSKAFLHKGIKIFWKMAPVLLEEAENSSLPEKECFFFPKGLTDFLTFSLRGQGTLFSPPFEGEIKLPEGRGRLEWAISWKSLDENLDFPLNPEEDVENLQEGETSSKAISSYCNTVPTPQGGVHEQGIKQGLLKAFRAFAERMGYKKLVDASLDDLFMGSVGVLSLFIKNPQFQGQTKEKLVNADIQRLLEGLLKDHFEHWLLDHQESAKLLLAHVEAEFENRISQKNQKELERKTATRRLRLPGKLADCSKTGREGTELFLVEGDSAGGSAKQARRRETQAILPLRGKILNVANATLDKTEANRELMNLAQALGCGLGIHYRESDLRYERVIIMTDADVDGSHIAALLMTFFFEKLPQLVSSGKLYLAQPPLYRITRGSEFFYALNEGEKNALLTRFQKGSNKVEISRFKGLGEMSAVQLKETTMDPGKRTLIRVMLNDVDPELRQFVNDLMGKDAEKRFWFIQKNANLVKNLDV